MVPGEVEQKRKLWYCHIWR